MKRLAAILLLSLGLAGASFAQAPIRVHCGGPAYTDTKGNVWQADTGFTGGSTWFTAAPISGTSDPKLFEYIRYSAAGTNFSYTFTVPNGSYTVNLSFAELWGDLGRAFNVLINGTSVLSNYSVRAKVGVDAADIESFPVSVTTGSITIEVDAITNNSMLDAIEILFVAPPPAPCPPPSNLTFTVNATLSWDDSTPTAPDPVTGFVVSDQTDCKGNFGSTQTDTIQPNGFVPISKGVNVQPQFITLRFTLLDANSNPVPGGVIQQTIPSQMLAVVPSGTYAASIVLVKGSNPVVIKSLSVSP